MNPSENSWNEARERIIGLGETSARKTYYAELQKRLDELKSSEENLRTVFNSTHDAIIIHDFDGRIEDVNEPMLALYRLTRKQALQHTVADLSAPDEHLSQIKPIFEELYLRKVDVVFEWKARRPSDGTLFDAEVALRTAVWQNRNMVVAVVRDITERKLAEQERLRLEDQLAQSRKMESVGQLAGGVAHDFNNMLTPILSYAMMLRDDMPKTDPRRADLDQIVHSAERARELTRQLLAFARKQTLTIAALDLNRILADFSRILRRTLRENILLNIEPAPGLSAIEGDAGQIEQVLLNLAVNAQDAMPDGGTLTIATRRAEMSDPLRSIPAGSYVMLWVKDTGTGIDAELRSKVFEPFFTTKKIGRGTGLGLSTVYGIVRQHNGYIELDSEVGKGTAFSLYFPAKPRLEQEVVAAPPVIETPKCSGKLLLVEDQPEVRKATQRMLERLGYSVLAASDGIEALQTAEAHGDSISLLVSDVVMSGLNGRELFERLHERQPNLKVVFISGYPSDVIHQHGVLAKGTFFLPKPFTRDELAEKIREALSSG